MVKSTIFYGQPLFSQIIGLLNTSKISRRTKEHKSDHYCKRFSTFQHLITMLYGVTSGCNSLRELFAGIVSYGDKIAHCKFDYPPKRSAISDANSRRGYVVFEQIYSNAHEHDSLFIQHEGVMNKNEIALFDKAYDNNSLFA